MVIIYGESNLQFCYWLEIDEDHQRERNSFKWQETGESFFTNDEFLMRIFNSCNSIQENLSYIFIYLWRVLSATEC